MTTAADKPVKIHEFESKVLTKESEHVLFAVVIGPDIDEPGRKTLHLRAIAAAKKNAAQTATVSKLPEDKSMKEQKQCPGFEQACSTMIGLTKELCNRCYGRRHYRQSHATKKSRGKTAMLPRKANVTSQPRDLEKPNGHAIALTQPIVDRLIVSFSFEQRLAMLRNFLEV